MRLTCDTAQQLLGEMLDMMDGKRCEVVVSEEVEYGLVEKVEYHAYVVAVLEPFQKMDTLAVQKKEREESKSVKSIPYICCVTKRRRKEK